MLACPANFTTNGVTLQCGAATDAQTPASGLSYNVQITGPNGRPFVVSSAALANGPRLLPAEGNAGTSKAWSLGHLALPTGDYAWSVQAIDGAFADSAFSSNGSYPLTSPSFNHTRR